MAGGNHYEALGVARDATADDVKAAWRRIAKASHPDRRPDDEAAVDRFVRAREAYEVLADPSRRRMHDLELSAPRRVVYDERDVFRAYAARGVPRSRRTVHAPPPSDHDVRALRAGEPQNGEWLIVGVGVLGLGPPGLMMSVAAASMAGAWVVLALALVLVAIARLKLAEEPAVQTFAYLIAGTLALGAAAISL